MKKILVITISIVLLLITVLIYFRLNYYSILVNHNSLAMTEVTDSRGKKKLVPGQEINIPSRKVQNFHKTLTIIDMHADTLLWGWDIFKENRVGHVDIPRLIKGNTAIQVFASVTKSSYGFLLGGIEDVSELGDPLYFLLKDCNWPEETWNNYLARTLYYSEKLHSLAERSEGKIRILKTRKDIRDCLAERKINQNMVGAVLANEGIYTEGGVNDFKKLFDAGFRMMSLAHFIDNNFCGSSNGVEKGGLTKDGIEMTGLMNDHGVVIDVAHISNMTIEDTVKITTKPLVRSHGGVKGPDNCGGNRNLTDDMIVKIANTGGVIGIGYWPEVICGSRPEDTAKAIRYTVELLNNSKSFKGKNGADHVGLGSDYDGLVQAHFDSAHIDQMTDALLKEKFTRQEIRKIMGENVLRVFLDVFPE